MFNTGVAKPWPKKNFLRPKLGSKVGDFSKFWMIFLCFRQNAAFLIFLGIVSNAAQK
jgi:hypothetical protein